MSNKHSDKSETQVENTSVEITSENDSKKEDKKTSVANNTAKSANKSSPNNQQAEQLDKKQNTSNSPKENIEKGNSGKGLATLAILIAIITAGAGGYLGWTKYNEINQQINTLSSSQKSPEKMDISLLNQLQEELNKLTQLQAQQQQQLTQNVQALSDMQSSLQLAKAENSELRNQLNKATFNQSSSSADIAMLEAKLLLDDAQRKLLIDKDIKITKLLLTEADRKLTDVTSSQAIALRTAINRDLEQLSQLKPIDQNLLMTQMSDLIAQVDNLKVLAINVAHKLPEVVSESVSDWRTNLKVSANNFMNNFIRVNKKQEDDTPELLAPDQDVYLKENIRLNLQVALLAIPNQHNDLYKQSLELVDSWIRTYFDLNDTSVKQFQTTLEQLQEQSIYIDIPEQLNALQVNNLTSSNKVSENTEKNESVNASESNTSDNDEKTE